MDRHDWTVDLGDAPSDERVQSILVNLTQRETTSRSAEFAGTLIGELGREAPLLRNTHRSAGFFVLLAPDVPAVLLELGFLTNHTDEARLGDAAARRRAMVAVADSIDVYFARSRAYAGR
jgi:N-acetylmuramoyl-L-alanine amidase